MISADVYRKGISKRTSRLYYDPPVLVMARIRDGRWEQEENMARIAGVDLPNENRFEAGLTYIYGIGWPTSRKILARTGIIPDTESSRILLRKKPVKSEKLSNPITW